MGEHHRISLLAALASLVLSPPAAAQLFEPSGPTIPPLQVPQPVISDLSCCGNTVNNITLEALFDYYEGPGLIHPQDDAALAPAAFSPMCEFTGTLVMRGGGCELDFGWYNVDDPAQIHVLVPRTSLGEDGYPKVPDGTTPADPLQSFTAENIRGDARYTGGLIGFALLGQPGELCTETKYSQRELNTLCTACDPQESWITAIIYQSVVTPNAYYMAFEDLPSGPDDFGLPVSNQWGTYENDGDFNDFVYFIEGITCEGGGQPCPVAGAHGACGAGITECLGDGSITCVQQVQPTDEVCDNIDNDCDGSVDDGELCPPGEVCNRGVCRAPCSGGEFPCPSHLVCLDATGLCMEAACLGVQCAEGQICVGGTCQGGCDGAVCPLGQTCQLGRCVDPCAHRQGASACPDGKICEDGACVESCHCRACADGKECEMSSGTCVPVGCSEVSCDAGTVCVSGACIDPCPIVVCPGNGVCDSGVCGEPNLDPGGDPDAGATGGGPGIDVDGGVPDAGPGPVGAAGSAGDAAQGVGTPPPDPDTGCGCRLAGGSARSGIGALVLLVLPLLRRRRRR